ncbi:ATP-binding protein [Planctomycetota bacterium]|nr:ATP-binding protein [Planctomycetota bacterium]
MSLKTKIALGVLSATIFLGVAMAVLGLEAKGLLEKQAQRDYENNVRAVEAVSKEHQQAQRRSVERLVLQWLRPILSQTSHDLKNTLARSGDEIKEAGQFERLNDDTFKFTSYKPEGSQMQASPDENVVLQQVFDTGEQQFFDDTLFIPHNPSGRSRVDFVLRLKLNLPTTGAIQLEQPEPPSFTSFALIGGVTLVVSMLGVFLLLMFALRRFVLSPLGDVLEDSERIVKGAEGLEVMGLKGGGDIETLVAAFNVMFAELKDYQSDLEGKIADGTKVIQRQQQSLVIAQRLAATGTLAAGLAHEVNNPLSGMLNAARRLRKRDGLDERAVDYIELIEEGLGRIEKLMKQILDFSRRRDMKPERFIADAPFKRSLPLVRHRLEKRNIRLEEDIHPDLPELYGNEEEIGQVLMNLIINAVDASPEDSAVRLSIQTKADGSVDYSIEDSGDGVPEDIRPQIFDPFFTTKEPGKGTGLGLSIVHTIINNHGGEVRVEDGVVLKGARFVVSLPPADKQESTRAKAIQ